MKNKIKNKIVFITTIILGIVLYYFIYTESINNMPSFRDCGIFDNVQEDYQTNNISSTICSNGTIIEYNKICINKSLINPNGCLESKWVRIK